MNTTTRLRRISLLVVPMIMLALPALLSVSEAQAAVPVSTQVVADTVIPADNNGWD